MKNFVDGGEAILEAFRSLKIDYVMASPGSEWGAVWEAFARQKADGTDGPTYFSCAHETLAVDLAIGYTHITGRPQAVMLHTGVGLLQGSMGIDAAQRQGIPMIVVSGEALTFGERTGFEPGPQWHAGLAVVGGTHRLAEPLVKWANQASSTEVIYQQIVRAGEMAQRTPAGPVYMAVPIETMLNEWKRPERMREAPPAPKTVPAPADIENVASLLAGAEFPVIIAEGAGRDPKGYDALVALAETLSIPVLDANWADFSNFPKDHPLYQGVGRPAFLDDADVVLTVNSRSPWYPSSSRPAKATIVSIDTTPFRTTMVHQNQQSDIFLEGDAAATLDLLTAAVKAAGVDKAKVESRKKQWSAAHDKLIDEKASAIAEARSADQLNIMALTAALNDALPEGTIFTDETITHRGVLLRYLENRGPQTYFRVGGGLGQGLGVSLGIKLAAKDRLVTLVVGDGSFMYNPITQSLALAKHANLPILIVVANNNGYMAMKKEHHAFYPEGVAASKDESVGFDITNFDYAEIVKPFGGYGKTVTKPADLPGALKEAQAAVAEGRTALLNVMLSS